MHFNILHLHYTHITIHISPLQRSESIAAWMNGLEIAYLRADLLSRELMMNTDISTQFIVAPLQDAQKKEGRKGVAFIFHIIIILV